MTELEPSIPPSSRVGHFRRDEPTPRFSIQPGPVPNVAAGSLIVGAASAGYAIENPILRAGVLLACVVVLYFLGVVQERRRRR
jgi:hypothetical protein